MANVIKKTPDTNGTYTYLRSVHSPNYPEADWAVNPDVSAVSSISERFWKWDNGAVVAMDETEQAEVTQISKTASVVSSSTKEIIGELPFSTTSNTPFAFPELASTPNSGTYFITFASSVTSNSVAGTTAAVCITIDGIELQSSTKEFSIDSSSSIAVNIQSIAYLDGSEEIEVAASTASGTVTFDDYALCIVGAQ